MTKKEVKRIKKLKKNLKKAVKNLKKESKKLTKSNLKAWGDSKNLWDVISDPKVTELHKSIDIMEKMLKNLDSKTEKLNISKEKLDESYGDINIFWNNMRIDDKRFEHDADLFNTLSHELSHDSGSFDYGDKFGRDSLGNSAQSLGGVMNNQYVNYFGALKGLK
jgi:DNA polymerase II large subunit